MANFLIYGDPLNPQNDDIVAQSENLGTDEIVPDGWRIMTGNERYSLIMRIAYRHEIEAET